MRGGRGRRERAAGEREYPAGAPSRPRLGRLAAARGADRIRARWEPTTCHHSGLLLAGASFWSRPPGRLKAGAARAASRSGVRVRARQLRLLTTSRQYLGPAGRQATTMAYLPGPAGGLCAVPALARGCSRAPPTAIAAWPGLLGPLPGIAGGGSNPVELALVPVIVPGGAVRPELVFGAATGVIRNAAPLLLIALAAGGRSRPWPRSAWPGWSAAGSTGSSWPCAGRAWPDRDASRLLYGAVYVADWSWPAPAGGRAAAGPCAWAWLQRARRFLAPGLPGARPPPDAELRGGCSS